ncbi:MAG TPA: ABC transporter ATP-binding protein [Thermodesulfobacteriota bacterium]
MTPLLRVEGLGCTFGGLKAVSDLSFTVGRGEILGLIGPNGAGKTTVVNLISGVIRPTSGRVTFDGADVTGMAPHALARLGLVRTFQATVVYAERTVRENALRGAYLKLYPGFLATMLDTATARRMRADAEGMVDRLLGWLGLDRVADQVAGSLPYGHQKTLGIVIALAAEPRLIMLDEPAAGLSAEEADHVRDTIKRVRDLGITVVVIDHNMRFISGLCDRVVVIHHGQELAQGKPQDVLRTPSVIEAYLGTRHAAARNR